MSDTASIFQYQPQILRETCEGIQRLDLRDQMLANREVELCGSVDAGSCAVLIRSLLHLQQEDAQAPIRMFINSPGGEVQSGLALYDVMQALNCPVNTICLGMAASMAALIFVSGARREMLPHSRIMIHDPLSAAALAEARFPLKLVPTTSCAFATSPARCFRVIPACRSTAFSNSRRKTPISRPKMPSRRVLPTP